MEIDYVDLVNPTEFGVDSLYCGSALCRLEKFGR